MTQALAGVRVLDLSRLLPGPYCTMMLGDLGAEIIKVEELKTGDPTRHSPPKLGSQGAAFRQVNRNKKSIAINLKNPQGRDLFLRLCKDADVVMEQFRPGVVDRLGIGYKAVSEINPRIVYCSLTGFGQDGPHRDRSGHDLNYLALSGVLGITTDDLGKPAMSGIQVADLAGGMVAGFGILAALLAREKTGRGQLVDVSMFDVMMSMLPIAAAQQFAGKNFQVGDKFILSGSYPFYNVYETSDGKWMTLGALEPKFWANFCTTVGRTDLIASQFADGEARIALFAEVTRIFKSQTRDEWIERMRHADCCCEPVLSLGEAFEHEQAKARQMVLEVQSASEGIVKQLGFACKLSDTPQGINSDSPELGEDTEDLLTEVGYSEDERRQLKATGVVQG
jgi:crotonobetainyl-CoA:carnitine CoA-transferase CaiB-like acyl-CoA transferase